MSYLDALEEARRIREELYGSRAPSAVDTDDASSKEQSLGMTQPEEPTQPEPAPKKFSALEEAKRLAQELGVENQEPTYIPASEEEEEGFVGGIWKSGKHGLKRAANMAQTAWNVATGDDEDVARLAQEATAMEQTGAQRRFATELAERRSDDTEDTSWWEKAKDIAGAIMDEPMGAFHEAVSTTTMSLPVMGAMVVGAAGAPMITGGGAVASLVGGIGGLFLGNTALETGAVATEQAQAGEYDRGEALEAGVKKGAVITGVDAVTLGLSKWMLGAPGKAAEKAIFKTLADEGVDITSRKAVDAALKSNKELAQKAFTAGKDAALKATSSKAVRAAQHAGAFGLETAGEGVGEALGSLAAFGEADISDAMLESIMSAGASAGHVGLAKSYGSAKRVLGKMGQTDATTSGTVEVTDKPLNVPPKGEMTGKNLQDIAGVTEDFSGEQVTETGAQAPDQVAEGAQPAQAAPTATPAKPGPGPADRIKAVTAEVDKQLTEAQKMLETAKGLKNPELETKIQEQIFALFAQREQLRSQAQQAEIEAQAADEARRTTPIQNPQQAPADYAAANRDRFQYFLEVTSTEPGTMAMANKFNWQFSKAKDANLKQAAGVIGEAHKTISMVSKDPASVKPEKINDVLYQLESLREVSQDGVQPGANFSPLAMVHILSDNLSQVLSRKQQVAQRVQQELEQRKKVNAEIGRLDTEKKLGKKLSAFEQRMAKKGDIEAPPAPERTGRGLTTGGTVIGQETTPGRIVTGENPDAQIITPESRDIPLRGKQRTVGREAMDAALVEDLERGGEAGVKPNIPMTAAQEADIRKRYEMNKRREAALKLARRTDEPISDKVRRAREEELRAAFDELPTEVEQMSPREWQNYRAQPVKDTGVHPREATRTKNKLVPLRDRRYKNKESAKRAIRKFARPEDYRPVEQEDGSWAIEPKKDRRDVKYRKSGSFQPVDTQSAAFKKWFGKSKIVNSENKPVVVYHGTTADFEFFDPAKRGTAQDHGWYGEGFYFSPQPKIASNYAGKGEDAQVLPVYLKIENPFTGDIDDLLEKAYPDHPRDKRWTPDQERSISALVQQMGYDGIIVSTRWGKIKEIVVFEPTQIKSAISNTGAFSETDPRIRYSKEKGKGTLADRRREALKEAAKAVAAELSARGEMQVHIFDTNEPPPDHINPLAEAAVDGTDVWINGDLLRKPKDVIRLWMGEAVGHISLAQWFRQTHPEGEAAYYRFLDKVWNLYRNETDLLDQLRTDYADELADLETEVDRQRYLAEEIVAHGHAEGLSITKENLVRNRFKALMNWVLKKLGIRDNFTKTDIDLLLEKVKNNYIQTQIVGWETGSIDTRYSKKKNTTPPERLMDQFPSTWDADTVKAIKSVRKAFSEGKLTILDKRYINALKKYGAKLRLNIVRHQPGTRFWVGHTISKKGSFYGPVTEEDLRSGKVTKEVVTKQTINGPMKITVHRDAATGLRIENGPIFSLDRKTRLQEIVEVIKKHKDKTSWYQDWHDFMWGFVERAVPADKISKYVRIQAVLSRSASPQGNQKLFAGVVDLLESGKPLIGGPKGRGNLAVSEVDAKKINDIWQGKADHITTLEQRITAYGEKVGPYMHTAFIPSAKTIVVDRHMPKAWGYNCAWNAIKADKGDINPAIRKQIQDDLIEAAKMAGVTPSGAQAAVWYEIRKADTGASTYQEAATLGPEYQPKTLREAATLEPQDIIQYRGHQYQVLRGSPLEEQHNTYSERDVGIRKAQRTKTWPYVPLTNFYAAGLKGEGMVRSRNTEPHLVRIERGDIYDLATDPDKILNRVRAAKKLDPDANTTNILAKMVREAGYKGYANKMQDGYWFAMVGEVPVTEVAAEYQTRMSDVVESIETVPQNLADLEKVAGARANRMIQDLEDAIKNRYQEVTLKKGNLSLAKFGGATSGKMEFGLGVTFRGPASSIRALLSEVVGIGRGQRMVLMEHPSSAKVGAPGFRVQFQFKHGMTEAQIQAALDQAGIGEYNIEKRLGRYWLDQFVMDDESVSAEKKAEQLKSLVEQFGERTTFKAEKARSELLGDSDFIEDYQGAMESAHKNYREHIVKHFGQTRGEVIYDQAVQRGNQHRDALRAKEKSRPGDSGKYRSSDRDGTGDDSGPHPPERPGGPGRGPEVRYKKVKSNTALDAALSNIHISEDQTVLEQFKDTGKRVGDALIKIFQPKQIQAGVFDQRAALKFFEDEAGDVPPEFSAYKSFRLMSTASDIIGTIFHHGIPKYDQEGHWITMEKLEGGLIGPTRVFKGDDYRAFKARMLALSVQELLERADAKVMDEKFFQAEKRRLEKAINTTKDRKEKGRLKRELDALTAKRKEGKEAQRIASKLYGKDESGNWIDPRAKTAEILNATDQWYQANQEKFDNLLAHFERYNRAVLEFAKQAGVVGDYSLWARSVYAPLNRVFEDMDEGILNEMFPRDPGGNIVGGIKRLKGGKSNIADPIESLMANYSYLIEQSLKNISLTKFYGLFRGTDLIEANPKFDPTKGVPKDVVAFRVSGKRKYFRVKDRFLMDAVMELDSPFANNILMKALRSLKRFRTWSVTLAPAFRVANFVRDTLAAPLLGKGITPMIDSVKGLISFYREPDLVHEALVAGGLFAGGYDKLTDIHIKRTVNAARRGDWADKSFIDPRRWWREYMRLGEAAEAANRLTVYKNLRGKGATRTEAAFHAKDLMDFSLTGKGTVVRTLAYYVPFLNARLQGIYKMGRAGNPFQKDKAAAVRFWGGAALMTACAIMLHAYNSEVDKDKDEYNKLNWYQRWSYIYTPIKVGDTRLKIPMPFEIGMMFFAAPAMLWERYAQQQIGDKEMVEFAKHSLGQTLEINPYGGLDTVVDLWHNRNSFTGRPIEDTWDQNLEPFARWDERTSKTARVLGEKFNISPKKLDFFVKQGGAFAGQLSLHAMDTIVVPHLKDFPEDPATTVDQQYWLPARFLAERKVQNPRLIGEYYDLMKELDQVYNTFNSLKKYGSPDEARAYRDKNREKLLVKKHLSSYQRKISDINTRKKMVHANRKLSGEEKLEQIRELNERRNRIMEKILEKAKDRLNQEP